LYFVFIFPFLKKKKEKKKREEKPVTVFAQSKVFADASYQKATQSS
jgi:hypothetical protein